MKYSAFIMGICPPHRLEWLRLTIDIMEAQNFPWHQKVLSVDQFGGHTFPAEFESSLKKKGWTVLKDSHQSRAKSMERAFGVLDGDVIFYNEDDVLATIPDISHVEEVFASVVDGRECGMLSLALGGTDMDLASGNLGDVAFLGDNLILKDVMYVVWRRLEEYRNAWFFEFPGLFIRSDLFKSCHKKAYDYRLGIEQGLTKAYFDLEMDRKYFKSSACKPNTPKILSEEPLRLNTHCRLLRNLDSRQGSGIGSTHRY